MINGELIGASCELKKAIDELNVDLDGCNVFLRDAIRVDDEDLSNGYKIKKVGKNIDIIAGEKVNFFRAILSLAKKDMKEDFEYSESRDFKRLSVMLDMSRNSVAKPDTLKRFIRYMAVMGYNELQLYTEDTFEVEGEKYFGYMRGRYTADEIKEIEQYALAFGIELIPCIQTLAHLNQIARYQKYQEFFDFDDVLLVGDERTYALIDNMFKTLANNFKARRVNIGMDEAHMLGLGKFLDRNGYKTRYEIMLSHLKKVQEIATKYGFSLEMWSDMFFRLIFAGEYEGDMSLVPQELIDNIPKDIKLLYWDYFSYDYNKYDKILKNHLKLTNNVGFAGGAWRWTGIVPDNEYSIATLASSIEACRENGIKDFVVTSWGDNGGESSIFGILPTLFYVSENAYGNAIAPINKTNDTHNYHEIYLGIKDRDKFNSMCGIDLCEFLEIDRLNKLPLNETPKRNNQSKFFMFDDALYGAFENLVPENASVEYKKLAKKINAISKKAEQVGLGYIFRTVAVLADVLSKKVDLSLRIKSAYDSGEKDKLKNIANSEIPKLVRSIVKLHAMLYEQWNIDNKPFGFEVQDARLGALMQRLKTISKVLNDYSSDKFDRIYELEEERLPFAYFENDKVDRLIYNVWSVIISPSLV